MTTQTVVGLVDCDRQHSTTLDNQSSPTPLELFATDQVLVHSEQIGWSLSVQQPDLQPSPPPATPGGPQD